jgi:hypothetical protein
MINNNKYDIRCISVSYMSSEEGMLTNELTRYGFVMCIYYFEFSFRLILLSNYNILRYCSNRCLTGGCGQLGNTFWNVNANDTDHSVLKDVNDTSLG